MSSKREPDTRVTELNSGNELDPFRPRIKRKIDWAVLPPILLFFLLSFLDRTNIGNARIMGLEKDLQLSDWDYRIALTILYIPYILVELPTSWFLKLIGASRFIPTIAFLWGVTTMCQAFVQNKQGLWTTRFFLGLFEGGMLPAMVLYLTFWYRTSEIHTAIALFWVAAAVSGAFGGLLASAIGLLDQKGGLAGWAWIFLMEGFITVSAATIGFWWIPSDLSSCKFLSTNEKDHYQSTLDSRFEDEHHVFCWSEILSTFSSPLVWCMFVVNYGSAVAMFSLAYFLPTLLKAFEYDVWLTQLLTVPIYTVAALVSLVVSYYSDKYQQRNLSCIFGCTIALLGAGITYYATQQATKTHPLIALRYFSMFLFASGAYTATPATLATTAQNIGGYYRRGTAIALLVVSGNLGGLTSTWLFRSNQAPHYRLGYLVNMSVLSASLVSLVVARVYITMENRRREQQVNSGCDQIAGARKIGDRSDSWRYKF